MKDIKKLMITLVALLAVALTANADNLTLYLTIYGLSADPNTNTPYYTTDTSIDEGTVVTIRYTGNDNTTVLSIYINGEVVSSGKIARMKTKPYTFTAKKNCFIRVEGNYAFNFTTNPNVYFTQDVDVDVTGVTLSQTSADMTVGGETLTLTATVAPDDATDKTVTWTTSDASVATVTDGVVAAVAAGTATITVTATNGTADTSDDFSATCEVTVAAASPSSAFDVDWDKAKKTGSFTMPGGNVTLEPEYYTQAALAAAPTAKNDVPATTDGAIVNAGTVKNIGETTTAQGTLMYYVSQTEMTDAALLALAADAWTADVPTAQSLAEGQAYVYYYVRGNDGDTDETTFSDGDILSANALTVNIAAEPTYAVTFADGTAEPTLWKADPATGVTKGQQVTVTYTGTKKVIGVKAEKKAAAAPAVSFTVKRVDSNFADGNYTVAPGTTWQQFIESGNAPACLSIVTSGIYSGKVRHDVEGDVECCGGTLIANVADKKRVKASDAIIDGATYGCSDYLGYEDHD